MSEKVPLSIEQIIRAIGPDCPFCGKPINIVDGALRHVTPARTIPLRRRPFR